MNVRKLVMTIASASALAAIPAQASNLEEIIVTAQKREQSLIEVPLAVGAISGATLEAKGVESVADLEFSLPSLVIAENSGGGLVATALVTRGIGVNGNIPYFEPSTALFIDGAFRSRSALGMDDLVNIERVEYLRGPQSTLYGRNASAGVISIYTQRPREEWGGQVEATVSQERAGEDPMGYLVRGEASGPLSDKVGAGLSFTRRENDDLYEVTGSPEIDSVNGREDYSIRGQLEFQPSEALNIRVTGGTADRDVNGPATELFFDDAALGGLFTVLEGFNDALRARQGGADLGEMNPTVDFLLSVGAVPTPTGVTVTPPHNDPWDRKIHLNDRKQGGLDGSDIVIDAAYEINDGLTFNAVASWNEYEGNDSQDIDQLTWPVGKFAETQEGDAMTLEVRLTSEPKDSGIGWIIGAFYLKDEMERDVQFQLGPNAPLFAVGLNGDTGDFTGGVDTESISIFGQVDWDLSDRAHLSLGARWIDEEKDAEKINDNFNGTGPASPVFQAGGFAAIFDPTDSGGDSLSTSDGTYSINLSYDLSDEVLVYALHSRGFKSGGFNVVWGPIGVGENGFEFDDETVKAFEVGMKGTFLDGALQSSLAAFHQTHDNYQTAAFIGTIFNLSNAEEASTKGVEADLSWAPTDALLFTASLAWTDAQYEDFKTGPCNQLQTPGPNGFCDQSGYQLPFVSDWTGNVSAQYTQPMAMGDLILRADLAMATDYNPDLVLAPYYRQDGYERLSLRATWRTERFDITVFGNNVTDAEIVDWAGSTNVIPGGSGQFVIQSGPVYGITGRVNF